MALHAAVGSTMSARCIPCRTTSVQWPCRANIRADRRRCRLAAAAGDAELPLRRAGDLNFKAFVSEEEWREVWGRVWHQQHSSKPCWMVNAAACSMPRLPFLICVVHTCSLPAFDVQIDKKVNKYPGQRTFTAIGIGGGDFRATMLAAVEGVVGSVHVECVSERPSSGGKYLSVRIGPVWVHNADQVRQHCCKWLHCIVTCVCVRVLVSLRC